MAYHNSPSVIWQPGTACYNLNTAAELAVGLLAGRRMRGLRLARPLRLALGAQVGGRLHESVAGYVGLGYKQQWLQVAQSLISQPTLRE